MNKEEIYLKIKLLWVSEHFMGFFDFLQKII